MTRYRRGKRDSYESLIVEALRQAGCTVDQLDGEGTPDLLVGYEGLNFLFEVKGKRGKLTDPQKRWHKRWRGQVDVISTIAEAKTIIHNSVDQMLGYRGRDIARKIWRE